MIAQRTIKVVKGVIYLLAFMLIGLFLYLEQDLGVMHVMTGLGVPAIIWTLLFFLSGIINFVIALTDFEWNLVWFTPYFMYVSATVVSLQLDNTIPTTAFIVYLLLALLIVLDVIADIKRPNTREKIMKGSKAHARKLPTGGGRS